MFTHILQTIKLEMSLYSPVLLLRGGGEWARGEGERVCPSPCPAMVLIENKKIVTLISWSGFLLLGSSIKQNEFEEERVYITEVSPPLKQVKAGTPAEAIGEHCLQAFSACLSQHLETTNPG